eukprot:1042269-Rhodomonas_salina.1
MAAGACAGCSPAVIADGHCRQPHHDARHADVNARAIALGDPGGSAEAAGRRPDTRRGSELLASSVRCPALTSGMPGPGSRQSGQVDVGLHQRFPTAES